MTPAETKTEIDQLLATKARIEEIIANQPQRKRQLAKQLAEIVAQIDALQGQRLLF